MGSSIVKQVFAQRISPSLATVNRRRQTFAEPRRGPVQSGNFSGRRGRNLNRRFEGQVAIVTGGGSGAGRATARLLAAEGAAVVIADLRADAARETADEITLTGAQALGVETDVSSEESVRTMVATAAETFGRLDILHNNAAALSPELHRADGDLTTLDLETWNVAMSVNAAGVMLGCKHAVPAMRASGRGGAIVNTASVSALFGDEVRAAYGSSKAAVIALTRYVATMYGREGIRCNAVVPGLIMSPTAQAALSDHQLAAFAAERLLPWAADPEDIANAVAWLASNDARCVTGQMIVVDSGTTTHRPQHAMAAWQAHLLGNDNTSD